MQSKYSVLKINFISGLRICVLPVLLCVTVRAAAQEVPNGTINRKQVVTRHNITLNDPQLPGATQVGDGELGYGFDITGMQTFNAQFATLANWAWHSFPLPAGTKPSTYKKPQVETNGRMVSYDLPDPAQPALSRWLEGNPAKFNLGRIGMILKKKDGSKAQLADIEHPVQRINLWTGVVESEFALEGESVKVTTVCAGIAHKDVVGFKIESALLKDDRLQVFINFPYAGRGFFGNGADYEKPDAHHTAFTKRGGNTALFKRVSDSSSYQVKCRWANGLIQKDSAHHFTIRFEKNSTSAEISFAFSPVSITSAVPAFAAIKTASILHWKKFWSAGAAIDLSASKDARWFELERRIVLSQYDMAINAGGSYPPAETGLVSNSWYGRFHYEMIWWHLAHYALWNRWDILSKSLHVYQDNLLVSERKAKRQGYAGARWPKCPSLNGTEWPHEIHAWLIWQQPHPIFFAMLDYRAHPTLQTLQKWKHIVGQTADFMASYPVLDRAEKKYALQSPLFVVSENNDPLHTRNPAFELSYWHYGLQSAQTWWRNLQLAPNPRWQTVAENLSPLPVKNGLYEQWENTDSMWTKFNYEHPALLGAFGMLPNNHVDKKIMDSTFRKFQSVWKYDAMWGWDFPMAAMTAARLGHPADAVNLLLDKSPKFQFDEHGFVGGGNPYPYFPSNGGLLYAVAMMTAGWDGDNGVGEPGWSKDGSWVVRWEGLKKAP